jgi:3'(2'), 5'-bisphosphate nucleotidase
MANALYCRFQRPDSKAGGEPVTEADRTLNRLIVSEIEAAYPDDAVIAEENIHQPQQATHAMWLVDPIDGTREFLQGTGQFAIHVARVVDQKPVIGIVNQAATHTLYYAASGLGAWVEVHGQRRRLHVSGTADPSQMRLAVSPFMSRRLRMMIADLGLRQTQRSGGVGLKACLVASGECDLYLHPTAATSGWDLAAPAAIVLEAGGTVTDMTGETITYDPESLRLSRGIAVSNGRAHERLLSSVAKRVQDWLSGSQSIVDPSEP